MITVVLVALSILAVAIITHYVAGWISSLVRELRTRRLLLEAAAEAKIQNYAFEDALIALTELGHEDVANRLRDRWRQHG